MDEVVEDLRRRRAVLEAEADRAHAWSRLVRARIELLAARVCPPEAEPAPDLVLAPGDLPQGVAWTDLAQVAPLVLGLQGRDRDAGCSGEDCVEQLLRLRTARRLLARYRDALDDAAREATRVLVAEVVVAPAGAQGSARESARPDGARQGRPAPTRPVTSLTRLTDLTDLTDLTLPTPPRAAVVRRGRLAGVPALPGCGPQDAAGPEVLPQAGRQVPWQTAGPQRS